MPQFTDHVYTSRSDQRGPGEKDGGGLAEYEYRQPQTCADAVITASSGLKYPPFSSVTPVQLAYNPKPYYPPISEKCQIHKCFVRNILGVCWDLCNSFNERLRGVTCDRIGNDARFFDPGPKRPDIEKHNAWLAKRGTRSGDDCPWSRR